MRYSPSLDVDHKSWKTFKWLSTGCSISFIEPPRFKFNQESMALKSYRPLPHSISRSPYKYDLWNILKTHIPVSKHQEQQRQQYGDLSSWLMLNRHDIANLLKETVDTNTWNKQESDWFTSRMFLHCNPEDHNLWCLEKKMLPNSRV